MGSTHYVYDYIRMYTITFCLASCSAALPYPFRIASPKLLHCRRHRQRRISTAGSFYTQLVRPEWAPAPGWFGPVRTIQYAL